VKEAEPITVEPHLYFIVRESATAGRVKNPFATTCINAPLVKVLAGIVLLPTTVPIREVSLAVLVAAALVVEEKKVEPGVPPPAPDPQAAPAVFRVRTPAATVHLAQSLLAGDIEAGIITLMLSTPFAPMWIFLLVVS
jgi:hypothetical protein